MTKIEWVKNPDGTQGEVWNPTVGCTKGCSYCYARDLHQKRHLAWLAGWEKAPAQYHVPFNTIQLMPERLAAPLKKRKPTTFFVDSVGDLFDPQVPFDYLDKVYAAMALCPQHVFVVLTKFPERMAEYWAEQTPRTPWRIQEEAKQMIEAQFVGYTFPFPNVYHGTSVENHDEFSVRIPHLMRVPGKLIISYEPALGPLYGLPEILNVWANHTTRQWVKDGDTRIRCILAGTESGKGALPVPAEIFTSVRDQCEAAGVDFFLKQAYVGGKLVKMPEIDGKLHDALPWVTP